MDAKAKAARNAYHREWNRRNPDKVKAAQEKYWAKKAQQAQEKPEAQPAAI